jgi:GNAT superfamily N-acetyltransferase
MKHCIGHNQAAGEVEIHEGYEPGLIGRVAELHGRYYAAAWGAGASFEILVSREFCDFIEYYDPENDLVLSANLGGELIGSIAIVGRNPDPDGVHLRFFIVDPAYHGRGAGKALLGQALDWCRRRGFLNVFLWTGQHLPESRGLYEKTGFRVTERCHDARFTVPGDNIKMKLTMSAI